MSSQEVPNLQDELANLSRESEELKGKISSIDTQIKSRLSQNAKLEEQLKKPLEGSREQRVEKSKKYMQSYSSALSEKSQQRDAEYLKLVENQGKKNEKLKEEKARNSQLMRCAAGIRKNLTSISETVGVSISVTPDSGNIGLLARFIRTMFKKDLKSNVALEVKKSSVEVIDEELRQVNPGSDKSFDWNDRKGLSDNVERLMIEYLASPGYHSADRQKSAQDTLKKIEALRNDPKRDQKLMEHIRQQTIASHGLTKKRSKLHSIYREAELSYRSQLIIESKVKEKELKTLNKAVEVNEKLSIKLASSVTQSEEENRETLSKTGGLKVDKEELRGKIISVKQKIEGQKAVLKQKRSELFKLQQDNLLLGMRYNSSDETAESEAAFLKEQLPKLEMFSARANKMDEVKDKTAETEREIAEQSSSNAHLYGNIQVAYHEVRRISRDHKELTMAPIAEDAAIDYMATKVEEFANALKKKAPTVSPEVQASSVHEVKEPGVHKMD